MRLGKLGLNEFLDISTLDILEERNENRTSIL